MENNLSVSDLNSYIKGVFDDELVLHNLSVYGELFQYSVSGGNTYFTLKENDCYLHCLKFGTTEKLQLGTQVTVYGSIEYYKKGGKVTFIAKSLTNTGKGKQYADFLKMKEKLKAEGLFTNTRIMPTFVKKVAVVTSSSGAVIHDFLSVLAKNHAYLDVCLQQTKVQGENADTELSVAITQADAKNCDIIVIARGGGDAIDLDCFNSEKVVRAIASCQTPTISAVGHQTDYTLCDLASTVRVGTPSIAGETIAKINESVFARLITARNKIDNAIKSKLAKTSSYTYILSSKIISCAEKNNDRQKYKIREKIKNIQLSCSALLNKTQNKIVETTSRTRLAITKKYDDCDKKLALCSAKLEFCSPLKILAQGYALVTKNGIKINSYSLLGAGDKVNVRFFDGQVCAEIKGDCNEI